MTKPTWKTSVEKARRAMFKSLAGRMEVAEASLEQAAFRHQNGHDQTLARFASDVGVDLHTLSQYRQIYVWLDWPAEARAEPLQVGWSTIRAAKWSGLWKTGADFLAHAATHDPPTHSQEGFEPFTPRTWTEDAILIQAGQKPRHAALVAVAVEAGRDVSDNAIKAAQAADKFAEGAQAVADIDDADESRTVWAAADQAKDTVDRKHFHNVAEAWDDTTRDPDQARFRESMEALRRNNLPNEISLQAGKLIELLDRVPAWLDEFGHRLTPTRDGTWADLMMATLDEERGQLELALAHPQGDVADEAEQYLANH